MQKELDRFTNQARFIQMIIDGKLIVSKKKKLVLVAELKKLNFKAFSKVADAIKEGELAPIADNDEEAEEDIETGANAYDYLLGMPIWSLTQERIDKLNKQIGDVELAIDTLIKLSKEDIWKRDLDDFIAEWRLQIDEEAKRQKKIDKAGRRASNKLNISAAGPTRKRKAGDNSDDSDFAGPVRAKKAAPVKKVAKEPTGLMAGLAPVAAANQPKKRGPKPGAKAAPKAAESSKPAKKESQDVWMDLAGDDSPSDPPVAPIFQKAKPAAATTTKAKAVPPKVLPTKATKSEDEDSADEEILRPAAPRGRRAATKTATYTLDDSDDDDNGDGLLLDMGKMVKGIGSTSQDGTSSSRPLFSTSVSRPGSSAGLPKKSLGSARQTMEIDEADDTDYAMLAPPPIGKKAVTAKETVISDDTEEEDDPSVESPPKPKVKPAKSQTAKSAPAAAKAGPKKAPALKKSAAPKAVAEPKKLPLSPAAKAYAAKKAKQAQTTLDEEDDEVEKVANALLDDDEEDAPVARRPARKAAVVAVSKKKGWGGGSDDEDEDDEASESESEAFEEEGSSFD